MPGIVLDARESNEQGKHGPSLSRSFILVEKTGNKQLHGDFKAVVINADMMKSGVSIEHITADLTGSGVIFLFRAPRNK